MKEDARRKAQEEIDRRRQEEMNRRQEEMDRRQREDIEKRRREIARREEEQRTREVNDPDSRRKEEVVAAARRAAGAGPHESNPYGQNDAGGPANAVMMEAQRRRQEFERQSGRGAGGGQHESNPYGPPQNDTDGPANAVNLEAQRRRQEFERQQEEMKRREEDIIRTRRQNDIARRQEEAEAAARAARPNLPATPSQFPAPRGVGPSRIPSFPEQQIGDDAPLIMPLESPTRHDDEYSTDRESATDDQAPWHRARAQQAGTPTRAPVRGYVVLHVHLGMYLPLVPLLTFSDPLRSTYPPPVTTTSPPPGSGPVRYPALMSQHQLKQGYAPSLQSMFVNTGIKGTGPASLLFVPDNSSSSSNLYPSHALPRPTQPSQYPYGPPQPPQHQHNASTSPYPGYPGPVRNTPEPPTSIPPHVTRPTHHEDASRISHPANSRARADPVVGELKNVTVPRDCLPKFLSIAALNTSRNRETCGLLLGKDKGHKFAVTTLLIPKQHSTSDTCTMDEEELVMMFTEERSLITLGWVS
jgi:STAM-binding protein